MPLPVFTRLSGPPDLGAKVACVLSCVPVSVGPQGPGRDDSEVPRHDDQRGRHPGGEQGHSAGDSCGGSATSQNMQL